MANLRPDSRPPSYIACRRKRMFILSNNGVQSATGQAPTKISALRCDSVLFVRLTFI